MRIFKLLCDNSPSKIRGGAYRLIVRGFEEHNHFRNLSRETQ